MATKHDQRVLQLLEEACDLDASARQEFLSRLRDEVPTLQAELAELLDDDRDDASTDGSIRSLIAKTAYQASGPTAIAPDVRVGGYRIIRLIAHGGMGSVYEAEQDRPRRRVALKTLQPGILSPESARRFAHEAEILGRLQHPGIARVLEAGVDETEAGARIPFFVMELIDGVALTTFADRERFSPAERLELIARVADAVAHAHARGFVHRDLKPQNILVDETGQPKVLDFGVARSTTPSFGTLNHTQTGQLVGTLPYMAPEQAGESPDAIDERTDVYALGVIAFELLAGRLPLDLRNLSVPRAIAVLRDCDPDRLATVMPSLRGDIDAIVSRALFREKEHRYASMTALAEDIRRFLTNRPIIARPPSASYLARRFVRRHRGVVVATLLIFLTLIGGIILALGFAGKERRMRVQSDLSAAGYTLRYDVPRAKALLTQIPPEHRGWDWAVLNSIVTGNVDVGFRFTGRAHHPVRHGPDALLTHTGTLIERLDLTSGEVEAVHAVVKPDEIRWLTAEGRIAVIVRDKTVVGRNLETGKESIFAGDELVVRSDLRYAAVRQGLYHWRIIHYPTGETVCERESATQAESPLWLPNRRLVFIGHRPMKKAGIWDTQTDTWHELELGDATGLKGNEVSNVIVGYGGIGLPRWNASTGRRLEGSEQEHDIKRRIDACILSPSGKVAGIVADGIAFVIDTDTGEAVREIGQCDRHCSIAFSADERHCAFVDRRESIILMDIASGTRRRLGVNKDTSVISFSRDGESLAAYGEKSGSIWRIREARPRLHGHTSYVYDVAISPDGRRIASVCWDGQTRLWDLLSGAPITTFESSAEHYGAVAFDSSGRWLLTAHTDVPELRDLTTGARVDIIDIGPPRVLDPGGAPGEGRCIVKIDWHPSQPKFAISAGYRPIVIGRVNDQGIVETDSIETFDRPLYDTLDDQAHAVFDADGESLYVVENHRVSAWSTTSRTRQWEKRVDFGGVYDISAGPGRETLVVGTRRGTAYVFDVSERRVRHELEGHIGTVYATAISPDGTRIATGDEGGSVRLWDTERGEEIYPLEDHEEYVHALAFTPDGERLVSGSGDTTLYVWEATSRAARVAASVRHRERHDELVMQIEALQARGQSLDEACREVELKLAVDDRPLLSDIRLELGTAR